jgi:hypothetical protein
MVPIDSADQGAHFGTEIIKIRVQLAEIWRLLQFWTFFWGGDGMRKQKGKKEQWTSEWQWQSGSGINRFVRSRRAFWCQNHQKSSLIDRDTEQKTIKNVF